MTADPRVAAVAAVLRRDGWTCDYHEPVDDPGECPDCDEGHASTAGRIVAALDAYDAAACACGAPLALGVVHRRGAPCYLPPDEAELVEVKSLREREARVRAVCDAEWDWKAGRSLHAALRAAVDGEA